MTGGECRAGSTGNAVMRWPVMATYIEYLRISFHKMLAYRISYLIGVFTYGIHVAVYYYLYKALYAETETINGYKVDDMLTYVAVGWICKSFYLNYIDRELTDDVQSGQVAMDLIKPIDFQAMYFSRGLGHSAFRLVLFTPPIVVLTVLLFSVNPPADAVHAVFFIFSTLMSVLIYLGINYIIGVLAIFFLSIRGVLYSKNLVIELLSGLLVPIDWFPDWFRTMSAFLPFQGIAYYPLAIYLGRIDGVELLQAVGFQALWVVIMIGVGRFIWMLCQKRILIQGG